MSDAFGIVYYLTFLFEIPQYLVQVFPSRGCYKQKESKRKKKKREGRKGGREEEN